MKKKYKPIFLTDQKIFFVKKKASTNKFLNFILNKKKYNKKKFHSLEEKLFIFLIKRVIFKII